MDLSTFVSFHLMLLKLVASEKAWSRITTVRVLELQQALVELFSLCLATEVPLSHFASRRQPMVPFCQGAQFSKPRR